MSLEARLTALADDAFPPTPDLAAAVPARLLGETVVTRRFRRARVAAAVAVAVLIPAGTVAAIELWGPDRVRVRTVEGLPPAPATPAPQSGERVASLAAAADRAGFEPHTPPFLDARPTDIRVRDGVVTFRAGPATVTEVGGRLFVEKTIGSARDAQRVIVDGAEGWFFTGPHDVLVETAGGATVLERRRAGPTLVYERDGVVVRVEGLTAPPRSPAPAAP